jgi:hypothetical protein
MMKFHTAGMARQQKQKGISGANQKLLRQRARAQRKPASSVQAIAAAHLPHQAGAPGTTLFDEPFVPAPSVQGFFFNIHSGTDVRWCCTVQVKPSRTSPI